MNSTTSKMMRKQKMEILSYKVFIKDETVETKTAGGIILPGDITDGAQAGAVFGKVIAMGPRAFKPTKVDYFEGKQLPIVDDFCGLGAGIGDRVLFVRNAGARFVKEGEEYKPIDRDYYKDGDKYYRILNDIDVMAIVEKANG